jgi:hypothetical protein
VDAEDQKLVTLARATRQRAQAAEGAALRDLDGHTYAAATVELPSLRVSALGAAISMALSSGAKGAEAAVVLTEGSLNDDDLSALRDFAGPDVTVYRGTPSGEVLESITS